MVLAVLFPDLLIGLVFFFFCSIIVCVSGIKFFYEVILMIITRYSIYDRKANEFGPSFEASNNDVAIRIVLSSLTEQSNLVLYPSDYQIVALCDFDTDTGETIKYDGSFVRTVAELNAIISDKFKQFALDGSFS